MWEPSTTAIVITAPPLACAALSVAAALPSVSPQPRRCAPLLCPWGRVCTIHWVNNRPVWRCGMYISLAGQSRVSRGSAIVHSREYYSEFAGTGAKQHFICVWLVVYNTEKSSAIVCIIIRLATVQIVITRFGSSKPGHLHYFPRHNISSAP